MQGCTVFIRSWLKRAECDNPLRGERSGLRQGFKNAISHETLIPLMGDFDHMLATGQFKELKMQTVVWHRCAFHSLYAGAADTLDIRYMLDCEWTGVFAHVWLPNQGLAP